MENVYLNENSLSWKTFIKYFIVAIILGVSFIFMEVLGIIQINAEILYNTVISGIYIFFIIQVINPRLNQCIVNEISFRSDSLEVIMIPILVAVIKRLISNFLQVLPVIFGGNAIGIAKGQVDMSSYNPIDKIIEGTIIGPLFEEFLFRIVFFTIITYIVGYIDNRFQKSFLKKLFDFKSILCWIIIVVNGSLFSLAHLPDISNFHLYFIGGVVYSIIYIKYGFYGSWLCHGFYNYFRFAFIFSLFEVN